MWKNEGKSKSVKKPLRDISNRRVGSSKSTKKKARPDDENDRVGSGNALDRLLLVHSDVSNIFRQIDELVVQVVKAEETDRRERKEIESITCVLSEMLSSLKPWVPRLQKALPVPSTESKKQSGVCSGSRGISRTVNMSDDLAVLSPEPTKKESLVSPSPLVSWRATGCTVEMGKQLFALTPLPRPKTAIAKGQASSKSVALQRFTSSTAMFPSCFSNAHNPAKDKHKSLLKNQPSEDSPTHVAKKIKTNSVAGRASPKCLKMSPISCFSNRNFDKVYKSTPFPLGKQLLSELLDDEESSGSEAPQSMDLKYSRSVLNPVYSASKGKRALDVSPEWLMSPPKTCTLMDPFDDKPLKVDEPLCDKPLKDDEFEILSGAFKQHMTLDTSKQDDVKPKSKPSWKPTNSLVSFGSSLALVEMTPMWKEPQSTAYKGKRPGENTLKRELWVRFDAASTDGLNLNLMFPREMDRNGFLDKLEEAS